jgi:hypothetical protein
MKRRLASLALAAVGILLAGLLLAFPQDVTPPAAPTGLTVSPADAPAPAPLSPFGPILAAYIISVIANRAFNWLWWWKSNRKAGMLGYFNEYGPGLAATMILHVFLFLPWRHGYLLPAINAVLAGIGKATDIINVPVEIPAIVAVTPGITLSCVWIVDSITSRVGMLLGSKFALFGGNGAAKEEKIP